MIKLNQRGTAAFEFCIVGAMFFITFFVIIDMGRFALTKHSLQMLANAGARDLMINCYTNAVTTNTSPSSCITYTPLPTDPARKAVAPFLFSTAGSPTLAVQTPTDGSKALVIKASLPSFTMLTPFWSSTGVSFNASATTSVPYM